MNIRNILLPAILLIFVGEGRAQTDCGDAMILSMTGHWKKDADICRGNDKNLPRINRCLDTILHVVQEACGELKGVEASWHRALNEPMTPGGPSAYSFESLYKPWYCNQHVHKLLLADETGTWVEIHVNWLGELITQQYNDMGLQINGQTIYGLPFKQGKWKGYDLYQAGHRTTAHCVILTRNGSVPWKPVSQREYLQAWRAFLQKQKAASTANTAAMQAADGGSRLTKAYDDQIKVVDDYVARTPASVLEQPAWADPKARTGFDGQFSSEAQGGRAMVTLDAGNYFSAKAPAAVPQYIVLHWRWGTDVASLHFQKQFEDHFPIEKLAALLDGSTH